MAAPLAHHDDPIYQCPRLRGVSAERFREFRSSQTYDDGYYVKETEPKVTITHIGLNNSNSLDYRRQLPNGHFGGGIGNGRLERQWSHPNLIPEPVGGRKLPMTPRNPPGTIIVIENVVAAPGQPTESIVTKKEVTLPTGTGKKLPAAPKMSDRCGSSAGPRSRSRVENERRSYSLPRPKSSLSRLAPVTGTGRRLPPTPHQAALPLQHAPAKRKRELPKPASLELRHSNREVMNASNAGLGLCGRSSRSMNFPRLDGSPTHSEDSGDEGSGFVPSAPLRSGVYPSRRVEY